MTATAVAQAGGHKVAGSCAFQVQRLKSEQVLQAAYPVRHVLRVVLNDELQVIEPHPEAVLILLRRKDGQLSGAEQQ